MPEGKKPRRNAKYARPLTREKIAAAALEIVRREGQSALSMRKVAGLFEVDVAALYRHVSNKEELLAEIGCTDDNQNHRPADRNPPGTLSKHYLIHR